MTYRLFLTAINPSNVREWEGDAPSLADAIAEAEAEHAGFRVCLGSGQPS